MEKSIPSINDLFERKYMIEDLEAELTGALTNIVGSLKSTCVSAHHVSQGQRTLVSSGWYQDNKQINKCSTE